MSGFVALFSFVSIISAGIMLAMGEKPKVVGWIIAGTLLPALLVFAFIFPHVIIKP